MSKGSRLEAKVSKDLHEHYTPVLVSSQWLRSYQAGQLDVCYWNKGILVLNEVKYSGRLTSGQRSRIIRSAKLLGAVLSVPVQIQLVKKVLPNAVRFFTLKS
jgi:hypothetical protein